MTMPAITSAVAGNTITASAWNTAFTTIRNHYNTYAAENVGTQTIAGAKTFSAAAVFSLGLTATAGGITVSAGGLTVTGNSTITGTLGSLTGITSTGTASFANVTASGTLGVTGTSTLGVVSAGAVTCTSLTVNGGSGTVSITGPTSASITMTSGNTNVLATSGIVYLGSTSALATNATVGFPCVPTCAGTPTGAAPNGAIVLDTSNNIFYGRKVGAWAALS